MYINMDVGLDMYVIISIFGFIHLNSYSYSYSYTFSQEMYIMLKQDCTATIMQKANKVNILSRWYHFINKRTIQ